MLAVGLLAVHAAVLDEEAGRAVLELEGGVVVIGVMSFLAAVGADFRHHCRRGDRDAAHDGFDVDRQGRCTNRTMQSDTPRRAGCPLVAVVARRLEDPEVS